MFGKAKMNQDPKMNAVGINDVSKLLEMKDQQMQLNEFNKDQCKATIDMLDEYKASLVNPEQNGHYMDADQQSKSKLINDSKLVTYHRNKFVKMWNKRQENEEQVRQMKETGVNQEFSRNNDIDSNGITNSGFGNNTKVNNDLDTIDENKNDNSTESDKSETFTVEG